jgi:glutamate-1-semialdehyde aminotransferase
LNHAMINRGVHLFGNGGIVSSAHTAQDIDHTIEAWSGALNDLQSQGVFAD